MVGWLIVHLPPPPQRQAPRVLTASLGRNYPWVVYEAELNAGNALFIPPFWIHTATALEPTSIHVPRVSLSAALCFVSEPEMVQRRIEREVGAQERWEEWGGVVVMVDGKEEGRIAEVDG